jgi:hypothetical protein
MNDPLAKLDPTRPDLLLRAEALLELVLCLTAYGQFPPRTFLPHRWAWFALLFLVPDISLVPYAFGRTSWGAALYNGFHSTLPALALGMSGWLLRAPNIVGVALIWLAHIAFDRCLGYGLKYPSVFRPTHIQRVSTL